MTSFEVFQITLNDGSSTAYTEAGMSNMIRAPVEKDFEESSVCVASHEEDTHSEVTSGGLTEGMDAEGFVGPLETPVTPLTKEELASFNAAQERTGVVYISRIPPGMRPTKVRHLMSAYGEIGRVYLQPEDSKRSYLRKKYTSTKKIQFTEGWVEFKDKKLARSVAEMLNAQPIGGKKGTRWRDDIWTMKYLPRFKWNMLTEQIAHEAAMHTAQLRVELSHSRREQHEYLKNVELARVLDKRVERKRKAGWTVSEASVPSKRQKAVVNDADGDRSSKATPVKKYVSTNRPTAELHHVLDSIF